MTQQHLQLHGQRGCNGKKTGCGRSDRGNDRGRGRGFELNKVIAEEDDRGKEFCRASVRHAEAHADFMAGLNWLFFVPFKG